MSKSALYTVNTNSQALAVGNTIDLGQIIRRFGCNANLINNNTVRINGQGYFKVNAVITITGTTAGPVNINLLKDGSNVISSSESVTEGGIVTIPLQALVRECNCSNLTFELSGTAETVSSITVIVEKI